MSRATFDDPAADWSGALRWSNPQSASKQVSFYAAVGKYVPLAEAPIFYTSSGELMLHYPQARVRAVESPSGTGLTESAIRNMVAGSAPGSGVEVVDLGYGYLGMLVLHDGRNASNVQFGPDGIVVDVVAPFDQTGQGRCQVLSVASGLAREFAETAHPSQAVQTSPTP